MVEFESIRELQLDDLNRGREPDVGFKTQQKPHSDELPKGRELEMVEFETQREPQLDDLIEAESLRWNLTLTSNRGSMKRLFSRRVGMKQYG